MDIHCNFPSLANLSLPLEELEKIIKINCNDFLKTREGLSYLCITYPNLSVSEAVNEYINNAFWIDSII